MIPAPRARTEHQLRDSGVLDDPEALATALTSWPEGPLSELPPLLAALLTLEPGLVASFQHAFVPDTCARVHLVGCAEADSEIFRPGAPGPHRLLQSWRTLHDCVPPALRRTAARLATHPLATTLHDTPLTHALSRAASASQGLAEETFPCSRDALEFYAAALLALRAARHLLPDDGAKPLLARFDAAFALQLAPHLDACRTPRLARTLAATGAPQLVELAVPLDPEDALPLPLTLHLLAHPELLPSSLFARFLTLLPAPLAWLLPATDRLPLPPAERLVLEDPATREAVLGLTTELRVRGLDLSGAFEAARLACVAA